MSEIVCVIPGPSHEYSRRPDKVRWCFGCRKHLPHDIVVIGDPPGVRSYYDRIAVRECSRCHRDRTLFPGWEYVDG